MTKQIYELKVMYNNNLFYVSDYEILGRSITLQDVLLALGDRFAINSNGDFLYLRDREPWQYYPHWSVEDEYMEYMPTYDLSKPLSEQSDELLEWIAKQLS